MDPEQQALGELDRAARAKRLLDDDLLREAFDGLREKWRSQWEKTSLDDIHRRESAYRLLVTLDEVEAALKRHLETGKMAEMALVKLRATKAA